MTNLLFVTFYFIDVVKETGLEEWSEFLNNKKLSDDNRIESSFGNIRYELSTIIIFLSILVYYFVSVATL